MYIDLKCKSCGDQMLWTDLEEPKCKKCDSESIKDAAMLIVTQRVWIQCSSDCDTVERVRTLAVSSDTPIGDIIKWSKRCNVIARGDITISEQDI